jgi:cytochrome c551/c552
LNLEIKLKRSNFTLALVCGLVFGLSCCSASAQSAPVGNSQTSTAANDSAANQAGLGMPAVAKKHNCPACHSITKKIVGPALMNIATKYKGVEKFEYNGKEYPLLEGLMMKVSLGGAGHWGSMPMPANDNKGIIQPDIRELVLFVLGLAK